MIEGDAGLRRMATATARLAQSMAPVGAKERLTAVDTLRGFALLGILPVNAVAFALPLAAYVTPVNEAVNAHRGPFAGIEAAAWLIPHYLCDLKMMTIFSMLFGAGLVLMSERAAARTSVGRHGFARIYYRRLGVLALIGLLHGFAIWYGDILVYYALSGLFLYPLRKLGASKLLVLAAVLLSGQLALNRWEGLAVADVAARAEEAEHAAAAGRTLTSDQEDAREEWEAILADHDPTPAQVADEVARVRGPLSSVLRRNTEMIWYNLTSSELLFWFTRALTAMLAGMALLKVDVLTGARSARFYGSLMIAGYVLGLPIVAFGVWQLRRHHFEPVYMELVGRQYNVVGSWLVALGHIGAVMLVCKLGLARRLTLRLAAVGQMALTNYLSQSVIGAAVFAGWGLGLFGRLTHAEVLLFTLFIWIAQLAWSSFWLSRFRYGPIEWIWRSATYGQWQRMTMNIDKE